MAIRLVVDSGSDLGLERANQMGITLVPLHVSFGAEHYCDGVDLSCRAFFEKLIETDGLPVTSQVSPYTFEQVFQEQTAQGDTVIAITISSKLSGTYQSACIAAERFPGRVFVVDSRNVSLGTTILVEYAQRLLEQGIQAPAIVAELEQARLRVRTLALLDTLEYLKKGGRISGAVAFAGSLLAIKPVVGVVNGEVILVGKARGSKNGNNLLAELVEKSGGIRFDLPYCLAYSGLDDGLLQKYISDSAALWRGRTDQLPVMPVGAAIGTHVGPGAIGVAFFSQK